MFTVVEAAVPFLLPALLLAVLLLALLLLPALLLPALLLAVLRHCRSRGNSKPQFPVSPVTASLKALYDLPQLPCRWSGII